MPVWFLATPMLIAGIKVGAKAAAGWAAGAAMSKTGAVVGGIAGYSAISKMGSYSGAADMSGALGPGTFMGDESSLTGGFSAGEAGKNLLGFSSGRQQAQQAGMLRGGAHEITNEHNRHGNAGIGGYGGDFDTGGRASMRSDRAKAAAMEREADRLGGRAGQGN